MKEPEGDVERRAVLRHFTCYPFHIQRGEAGQTGEFEIAVIHDLSASGAYLLATTEPAIGTRLKLHLDVFGEPGTERVALGRVVRTERRPADASEVWPFGIAVQFDDVLADLEPAMQALAKSMGRLP
jgi:hypothetical protein